MTDELTKRPQQAALATISKNEFLTRYSGGAVQKECRKYTTALQCAESGMPTIAGIRKVYGEDFTVAYLVAWMIGVQDFFNVATKMNEAQITETAYMILDDFYALNLADLSQVFGRAKRGKNGALYNRIDGAVVYGWFAEYFEERCQACATKSIRDSQAQDTLHPVTKTRADEYIKEIAKAKKEWVNDPRIRK